MYRTPVPPLYIHTAICSYLSDENAVVPEHGLVEGLQPALADGGVGLLERLAHQGGDLLLGVVLLDGLPHGHRHHHLLGQLLLPEGHRPRGDQDALATLVLELRHLE